MLHDRKNNTVWFAAGLGFGALVGVLLAPQSGRETRKAIAAGVDDGVEYVTSLGRDARERMSDMVASGKKVLARRKEEVIAVIDTGRNWTKRAKDLLRREA
jgi:gas vesicle protein